MRQQKADRSAVDTLRNHLIGKMIPGVGTWGEIDVLRGWKDDFLGCAIAAQYTPAAVGAGGAQLQPNAHGGWYNMWTGVIAMNSRTLWLGNAADGFATLDADEGWMMIFRGWWTANANTIGVFGAKDAAENNVIWAGYRVGFWSLETRSGGGAWNTVVGAAGNANIHWMALKTHPIVGGRQVDFYIDGTVALSTTTSVPTICLTPFVMIRTTGAVSLNCLCDYLAVIPRNLV